MSSTDNSRFSCLKSTNSANSTNSTNSTNSFRTNRFENDNKVNSRWQRSKSPETEKYNSFTSRGRRNFRNNRRCGPSKKFHNSQKDEKGRPIISGATNRSFNPIEIALQKKNQKNIVIKKEKQKITKKKGFELFEQTKMSDAEKQMILNMQYETDSEQEDEEDEENEEDM